MSHRKKNRHLNEIPAYTGEYTTQTHIQYVGYSADAFTEKQLNSVQEIQEAIQKEGVNWIRFCGMKDTSLIIDLVKSVGLNIFDAKDILTTPHIMSIEEYNEAVFLIIPIVYRHEEQIVNEQLAIIMGKNYLISIQESDYPLFDTIYQLIKNNQYQKFAARKSDFLLASLLNEIIVSYADIVVQLEDDLEVLEDDLLEIVSSQADLIKTIQEKRRETIRLRKVLFPFKDQLAKLLRVDPGLINSSEVPYFKDIYDQLLYTLQNIESCREILSSLVDLYLNNNDVKMNMVMKQLTLVATIFIPLTFLVGVWGMNFEFMPELGWKHGYLFAWIIMIAIGIAVWWYMKRKDWT